MELQVVAKKENPLLKRVEVTFKAVHKSEPTPTRDAIRSELAKQLKAPKESVIVDRSESSFGKFETLGYAKVYKSKEEALSVERSHILVRNKLKEAEVKEKKEGEKAAPAEKPAAKTEAKAEPKAEHKPEAKPEHKAEPKAEHKEEKAAKEEKKPAEKHDEKKEAKPEAKKTEPKKKEAK